MNKSSDANICWSFDTLGGQLNSYLGCVVLNEWNQVALLDQQTK